MTEFKLREGISRSALSIQGPRGIDVLGRMMRERCFWRAGKGLRRNKIQSQVFSEIPGEKPNKARSGRRDKAEEDPGRKQGTISPPRLAVPQKIMWVRGRNIHHSQGVWLEKHWAATPVSHRDFSAFALQNAVKTISNPLLFLGQNLLLLVSVGG